MSKKKLAIIGKTSNIYLYKIYGAEAFEVENEEKFKEVIQNIESKAEEYGAILIASELFRESKIIKKVKSLGIPVIPIPTHKQEAGMAYSNLESMVNRAVGMSLDFLK